jgi:transposase
MPAYIGIDVSKHKLDCAWLRDPASGQVKTQVWNNDTAGFTALQDGLMRQTGLALTEIQVVMEATGVYHEALAQALYEAGAQVCLMNPARIRDFAKSLGVRGKNDTKDSVVLARYGATQQPALWAPEPQPIRELKARIARLEALDADIQRENNRREKAEVTQASDVIQSIDTVLATLRAERKRLARDIDDHIDRHPTLKNDRQLLQSIPGIGPAVSLRLMTTLRSRAFASARQVAAFVGVVPVPWESGTSVRGRPHLSKAGAPKLRRFLYMAALVSLKYNPDIAAQYQRLIHRGKPAMSALGAAMRKLVHIAFGVLKHQTP